MTESHGPRQLRGIGAFHLIDSGVLGEGVVFEPSVLVFHPEIIEADKYIYIDHYTNTLLKGSYKNKMIIEEGAWHIDRSTMLSPQYRRATDWQKC